MLVSPGLVPRRLTWAETHTSHLADATKSPKMDLTRTLKVPLRIGANLQGSCISPTNNSPVELSARKYVSTSYLVLVRAFSNFVGFSKR